MSAFVLGCQIVIVALLAYGALLLAGGVVYALLSTGWDSLSARLSPDLPRRVLPVGPGAPCGSDAAGGFR